MVKRSLSSIVIDLQREATRESGKVSTLLRTAYTVARKLNVKEFETWIKQEMDGYGAGEEKPSYREIHGELKFFKPYRGWCPLIVEDEKFYNAISKYLMHESVSELESLISSANNISIKFFGPSRALLAKCTGKDTEFMVMVNRNQIEKILSKVKDIILDWSLKLEEDGILGEGMSFSKEEKEKAQNQSPLISFGKGASGVQIQIQQNTSNSSQTIQQASLDLNKVEELLQVIKDNINKVDLSPEQRAEISENIEVIEVQKQLGNPNPNLIKEGFRTIRNILEGITGSITASGIIHHLGLFLN
ncbi:hypothetical protein J8Y18_11405 [Bacillus cereus]|nr:hypothetical protein J8Y18_11405 [Bacillus cereus]